jgi:hypothetical protein
MIGLGSVDNTSDANKPISTATQTALNTKQDTFWVVGRLIAVGTIDKNLGSNTLTNSNVSANGSGVYTFTIPAHPNGATYVIMVTASPQNGGTFFCSSYVNSSTSFTVYTFNASGTAQNAAFSYHTIP